MTLRHAIVLVAAFMVAHQAGVAQPAAPTPATPASGAPKPKADLEPPKVAIDSATTFLRRISGSEYIAQISLRVSNENKEALTYSPTLTLEKPPKDLVPGQVSVRLNDSPSKVVSGAAGTELVDIALSNAERPLQAGAADSFDIQVAMRCPASDPKKCWFTREQGGVSKAYLTFKISTKKGATPITRNVEAGAPGKYSDDVGFNDPLIKDLLNDDRITQSGLFFEQAMIKKALADELFLRGDSKSLGSAIKKYDEASQIALSLQKFPKIDAKRKSTANLLLTEIDYRRTLLKGGLDFWGGYRSRTPAIPIRHLASLEDLFAEFEKALNQIDSFSSSVSTADQDLLKAKGALQELNGKLAAYLVDRDKALIVQQREWRSINDTWANIGSVEAQQRRIQAKVEQLAAQQASLSSRATALLTQAVARSAGVDPSMIEAVRSGDVKSLATTYIQSQVGDPSSDLMQRFSAISDESSKMVDLYGRLKEKKAQIDEIKSDFETTAAAIQKPTLENIAGLGAKIWDRLPPEEKSRITTRVKDQIPAIEWVRSTEATLRDIGAPAELLQRKLTDTLQQSGISTAELRTVLHSGLLRVRDMDRTGRADLERIVNATAAELLSSSAPSAQIASTVNAFASALPEQFVSRLPPEAKKLLFAELGVATEEQLISHLKATGLASVKISYSNLDEIYIDGVTTLQRVALSKASLITSIGLSGTADRAATEAERFLDSIAATTSSGISVVLSKLPVDVLASRLSGVPGGSQSKLLSSGLQSVLAPQDFAAVQEKISATMVGYASIDQVIAAIPAPRPAQGGPREMDDDVGLPQGGGPDPATSQAMSLALDAAFPGAGTALQLVQAFGSMDANRELNERLSQEAARLMARKVELIDRQTGTYFDELLAQKDQARSEALADASRQQIVQFQQSMQQYIEARSTDEAKIGLRRGWTFYLAERMREEFDQFDRAFALWSRGEASRGAVEQEVRSDPQNARYALDSDIQLYDWLSRTRESSRSDPDTLRVHWARMLRLAKDLCQKRGCKPGDGMLGQIAASREISILKELLSARDLSRFREWQRNPTSTFKAEFSILPFQKLAPSNLDNIRLIEIRASVVDSDGSRGAVDQVSLRHQGTSYIPRIQRTQTGSVSISLGMESMLPRSSNSFNAATEFDLESLRTRYDAYFTGSNLPSARIFEGYGLYATYELTIEPTPKNSTAADFSLRFAYHYNDSSIVANEAQFLQTVLHGGNNGAADALTVGVQESRANCTRLPQLEPRTLLNTSLETRWFFAPRSNRTIDALDPAQKKAVGELNACNNISLRPICRQQTEIAKLIDSSLATREGLAEARRLKLVASDAPIEALRAAMISRANLIGQTANCLKQSG